MILAIDFDDTLMDTHNVRTGYRMGPPTPGAIVTMHRLVTEGHSIYVFTARDVQKPPVYKAVEDWLNYYKIPFHGITNIKQPYFQVFIDNKAIQFDTWPQVMLRLKRLTSDGATAIT